MVQARLVAALEIKGSSRFTPPPCTHFTVSSMQESEKQSGQQQRLHQKGGLSLRHVQDERASRLWRFIVVTIGVWFLFSCYFWTRGYVEATLICITETLVIGLMLLWFIGKDQYNFQMNGYLTCVAGGLFALSICRGDELSETIYFLPICIIIAAQLMGLWPALIWCSVSIALTNVQFLWFGGANGVTADEMVNAIGLSATVLFLCQQSEHLFEKRTKHLLELSHDFDAQTTEIEKITMSDALTGLPNRRKLMESLRSHVGLCIEKEEAIAVLTIDMDGFKEVNDALGHSTGDHVLKMIAERIIVQAGENATVARLGGDEFCVLMPGNADHEAVLDAASQIVDELRRPYKTESEDLVLDASVGVSFCPEHALEAEQLIAFADTAMYRAMQSGRRSMIYDPSMTDELIERRKMQEKLSKAMERDEFRLVFQPQVDMPTGKVNSVETLLRWHHDGQVIPPLKFIPMLESSGEIVRVSRWIVEQCCQQIRKWNDCGYLIRISINISPIEFADSRFVDCIADSILRNNVCASQLEFEITESILIENVEETIDRLNRLKRLGSSISIDDFGTGYSSLSYLKQFPIDRLKIDRAFVKDFPKSDDGLIASSIIVLGQALGMKVIAEGVETQEQLTFLSSHGCDEYQGYFLSAPVSATDCEKFFCTNEDSTADATVATS